VYAPYPTQQQLTPQQRYDEYLRRNTQPSLEQPNQARSNELGSGDFEDTSEAQEQGGDF